MSNVLKSEEKVIDDLRFVTIKLPAMRAFALLARLVKTVGPALGALIKLDPSTQFESLDSGVASAFASIDAKEAEALVPEIFAATTVLLPDHTGGNELPLNTRDNINIAFSEPGLMTMFRAIGFVLQVNFKDFSRGGAPAAPGRTAAPAKRQHGV